MTLIDSLKINKTVWSPIFGKGRVTRITELDFVVLFEDMHTVHKHVATFDSVGRMFIMGQFKTILPAVFIAPIIVTESRKKA